MNDLNIPSFSDFLIEMGEKRVVGWSQEALADVQREIGVSFNLADPDDSKHFVTAMLALNQRTTVLMLQDYHEWLCRQLGKKSLRLI